MNTPVDALLRDRAQAALVEIADAARRAGEVALRDFRWGGKTSAQVHAKYGGSPVTTADLAVDRYLRERLSAAFPGDGWLSEETADDLSRLEMANLLVVDPIDGTRAFLTGDPRWAVSIALYPRRAPDRRRDSRARPRANLPGRSSAAGRGATTRRSTLPEGRRCRARWSAGQDRWSGRSPRRLSVELAAAPRIPSLALRLAQVADGGLDVGLASASANDWDVAGADIVLSEAGALLTDARGQILHYNRQSLRHGALLAFGADLAPAVVKAARAAFGDRAA